MLIFVLLIITAGLLYLAFVPFEKSGQTSIAPPLLTPEPSPTPATQTALALSPNPLIIASTSGSLELTIDTGANNVTAVQIELTYDPNALGSVDIIPGTFFDDPITLLKNVDTKNGKISYVLATSPTGRAKTGKGTVAAIVFTATIASGAKTQISFSPKTLVTAEKVQVSVLKSAENATIFYVQEGSAGQQSTEIGPFKPSP